MTTLYMISVITAVPLMRTIILSGMELLIILRILFHKKTRTGQKDNYSLGLGFSMTWSTPTDKNLQDLCKKAATTQIELNQQLAANKRLDFEIARLKNCGQLLKEGIRFAPGTRYAKVCEDVQVSGVNFMVPHVHKIPSTSSSSPSQHLACNRLIPIPLLFSALLYRQDLHLFLIAATFFKTFLHCRFDNLQ